MMKSPISIVALIAVSFAVCSCSIDLENLPPFAQSNIVPKDGSLANEALADEVALAMQKRFGGELMPVRKVLVRPPEGEMGRRTWRELWLYDPAGMSAEFMVTFLENADGSTSFSLDPKGLRRRENIH